MHILIAIILRYMNSSHGRYYIKRNINDTYNDITSLFRGVAILSLDGMNERGDAVNVYNEQWVNEQAEDFLVTKQETIDNVTRDVIIRKNVDLKLTFIIGRRYANRLIDEQQVYDNFVDYVSNGDFYIKSTYANKEAHVICLKGFKPTTTKVQRGFDSHIIATIELHTLDMPQVAETIVVQQKLYIGFGKESISNMQDILELNDLHVYQDVDTNAGAYQAPNSETNYLWLISTETLNPNAVVTIIPYSMPDPSDDAILHVPVKFASRIGDFYCYRSWNRIVPDTMEFTISMLNY